MSASAYSLSVAIPSAGFSVEGPSLETREAEDGGGYTHHFCPRCHTWIFTTMPEGMGFTNLRATMLDDASWYRPYAETQTSEKLAFAETGAAVSFERFPQMDEMMPLIESFAREGARPA